MRQIEVAEQDTVGLYEVLMKWPGTSAAWRQGLIEEMVPVVLDETGRRDVCEDVLVEDEPGILHEVAV